MPTLCIITFNESPIGVYYAGQVLSGKVSLTTDRIKTIKGIYININGYAKVRWNKSSYCIFEGETTSSTWYHAHEDHFQNRVDVLNAPDGDQFELMPGNHQYDFQVILPPDLPSSFISKFGRIAYEVKCVIDRSWKYDNVFKHPFTILSPLDLNMNWTLARPVMQQDHQHFSKSSIFGKGGRIYVKEYIPSGGFAPGQSIPVTISVESQLPKTCIETVAWLMQEVEYTSDKPTREHATQTRPVAGSLFGSFENNEKKDLSCDIYIPAVPPTSLTSFSIIKISYHVQIEMKSHEGYPIMLVTLPITIGTVPYYGNNNQSVEAVSMSSQITVTPDDTPIYEEALKIDSHYLDEIDEDKHSPCVDFVPKYPVYNRTVNITSPTLGN